MFRQTWMQPPKPRRWIGTVVSGAGHAAKVTYVALFGLTDVNGQISTSRSFISNQPVTGRVRKASAAPYYATRNLSGTIDSAKGLSVTTQLLLDQ